MRTKLVTAITITLFLISTLFALTALPVRASPDSGSIIEVSQPVQLTTDSYYERDSCFFKEQDGTYWLFFARGRGDPTVSGYNPDNDFYDIYYLTSTDCGITWTEHSFPPSVNDLYGQREMAAFQAADGTIWVFFTDFSYPSTWGTATGGIYYATTMDEGVTWSDVEKIPGISYGEGKPAQHMDALQAYGKIYVFFESDSMIYSTSFDGKWSTPIQISETGKISNIPKAMLDANGKLNVVWCSWTGGYIYRSTSFDGIHWSTPQLILSSSSLYLYDPMLVQDSYGAYWLFCAPWDSTTDSQWIEAAYSTDGVVWSSSIHVSDGGYKGTYWWDFWPEAYQEPGGNMLIFYTSSIPSTDSDGNIWMFRVNWNLKNNHYQFIQNAIDAASPGDTILVHHGTYAENVLINKELTVKGVGYPVIDGQKLDTTVKITSDNVAFKGFKILNGKPYGINVDPDEELSEGVVISRNIVTSTQGTGIFVSGKSYAGWICRIKISKNKVVGNDGWGLYIVGATGDPTLSIKIVHNEFSSNSKDGVAFETVVNALVKGNVMRANGPGYVGISIFDRSHDIVIRKNLIVNNDWGGIWIAGDPRGPTSNIIIEHNLIAKHQGYPGAGIEIDTSSGTVKWDTFTIKWNLICFNNYGIVLWDGPEENPYPNNIFHFNTIDYATGY